MRVPKYRRNPDGRAFVQINKSRTYLGQFGSRESRQRYREIIRELMKEPEPAGGYRRGGAVVSQLAVDYLAYAETYYRGSGEFANVLAAVREFTAMHGSKPASRLSPLDALEYQRKLIAAGYSRTTINAKVSRVKRWLKWCVSRELLGPEVFAGIGTVAGLRAGRSDAAESPPVQPVPLAVVESTLKHVAPVVATMARVQYLCGMRPDEVCRMRACDIDRTGEVWIYKPSKHKNTWRDKSLIKGIPPVAQKLLAPWITENPNAWLFSPRASVEWWSKQTPRQSKVYPHELKARRKAARKAAGMARRYTSATYGKAIRYGVNRANRAGEKIPDWSPNQLRHSIAGELSRQLGQQAAQRWLGHARLDTTAIYAGLDAAELVKIANALEDITRRAVGES